MTLQSTDLALAIPAGTGIIAMFSEPKNVDAILDKIEEAARAQATGLGTDTKKGRDAIASVAYQVARSKTALDDAGKDMNDEARQKINAVDAERRRIKDRLDALKTEIRKPLDDWERAEADRVAALKARLSALDAVPTEPRGPSDRVRARIAGIEATPIDDSWGEYLPLAAKAKDAALAELRHDLGIIEKREADDAELERLRAAEAVRAEEDRQRREAEEAEARNKALTESSQKRAREMAALGTDAFRTFWKSETDLPVRAVIEPIMAELRETAEKADAATAAKRKAEAEDMAQKAAADAKALAEKEAAERAATAKREADEREVKLKRDADEAAQRERDRIAREQKAADDARAKREADEAHRTRIRREIAKALATLNAKNWDDLADALMAGKIPHTEVNI